MKVAALYVDVEHGPYNHVAGVEVWGHQKDATQYSGPFPVVAHPPCKAWGNFAFRSNDDGSTAFFALESVRKWGGVMEHPAWSKFWRVANLPRPNEFPDEYGGYTIAVNQCDWGHSCAKPTWLYIVGTNLLPARPTRRKPTHELIKIPKSQRHLTPPFFAVWLVELARRSQRIDHLINYR